MQFHSEQNLLQKLLNSSDPYAKFVLVTGYNLFDSLQIFRLP